MTIISVNKDLLAKESAAWGVPPGYLALFISKSTAQADRVLLHPFCFNDTEHMTNQRHWLAFNAALWCCAYREAETKQRQTEALAGIRAMFYVAGTLGQGEVKALLHEWWRQTFVLHHVPAPNFSAVTTNTVIH